MRPEEFVSSRFGDVIRDVDGGLHWFDPRPLPRQLALEPETQIALSRADAALGRLDGMAQLLSNPEVISRPYASREAVASSRIEGTHATLTEVYESEAGKRRVFEEDVRAIDAYRRALELGLAAVDGGQLRLHALLSVHRELMRQEPRHQDLAGRWRTDTVWLGSSTGEPETATFVPPLAPRLQLHLQQWEQWHDDPPRLPLLVRVALSHYQLLTIHPFFDGNGRVGRMLIQMMLEQERALSAPLLYLSAFFARNRREYYDRLQAVRQKGEIQQWLQYFLTGVAIQADDGVARAKGLLELREHYRQELFGTRSRAAEVVDLLFINPFVSASRVQVELGLSNQGALNLLRGLERRGWLARLGHHGRGATNYWYAHEVLGLFDDESSILER